MTTAKPVAVPTVSVRHYRVEEPVVCGLVERHGTHSTPEEDNSCAEYGIELTEAQVLDVMASLGAFLPRVPFSGDPF